MLADGILDWVNGWLSILSGIWGIILLPWAISLFCERKQKVIGTVLMMLVGFYVFILIHDINAHLKNQRPWIPFYEWCFGLAIPVEGRSSIFATAPFDREKVTIKVTHVRRGKHSIGIWIPDKMDDFTPVGPDIKLNCNFLNKHGGKVFEIPSDHFAKNWTWCRGERGGSGEVYCIYSVPKDVPLDEELTLQINVSGAVKSFLQAYPNAIFTVDKHSDK